LAAQLNKALELNEQAIRLTNPASAGQKAQLIGQVDQMLLNVDSGAQQLEVVAAQRTSQNRILAYLTGGLAALLGMFAYSLGLSIWKRYRIKRALQMKISPK